MNKTPCQGYFVSSVSFGKYFSPRRLHVSSAHFSPNNIQGIKNSKTFDTRCMISYFFAGNLQVEGTKKGTIGPPKRFSQPVDKSKNCKKVLCPRKILYQCVWQQLRALPDNIFFEFNTVNLFSTERIKFSGKIN